MNHAGMLFNILWFLTPLHICHITSYFNSSPPSLTKGTLSHPPSDLQLPADSTLGKWSCSERASSITVLLLVNLGPSGYYRRSCTTCPLFFFFFSLSFTRETPEESSLPHCTGIMHEHSLSQLYALTRYSEPQLSLFLVGLRCR